MDDSYYSKAFFSYTFDIKEIKTEEQLSSTFYVRMLPWQIKLKPNARALGVFLQCNIEDKSPTWYCNANFILRLKCHKSDRKAFTKIAVKHRFYHLECDYGFANFITWNDLNNPENGLIHNNALTVEVLVNADKCQGLQIENITPSPELDNEVLRPTAQLFVINNNSRLPIRAIIDRNFNFSYIASSYVRTNGLKTYELNGKTYVKITIIPNKVSTIKYNIAAMVTNDLPRKSLNKSIKATFKFSFENLVLADPNFISDDPVEMELGKDIYQTILRYDIIHDNLNNLVALDSTLGWLIMEPHFAYPFF